jgi:DNA primase
MQFSKDFIQKVLNATDIVELVSEHGVALKQTGINFKGLCPFHSEKTPSFNVNSQRGFFHCFGCKASGDSIKFLMQIDRLSFTETVEELAKRAGIPLEKNSAQTRRQSSEEEGGLRCLREAASFYRENLSGPVGKIAQKYLHQRQVSENMSERFQLGISPDSWDETLKSLKQKNIPQQIIARAGLIKSGEKTGNFYDTFRGRLMFPIKDVRGRCIGFGARAVKPDDKPKYLNSPETSYYHKSRTLYGLFEGLEDIRKKRRLIFVEGYLDVIRLHEHGFTETVAPCGTALTPEHLKIVSRYADTAILLFDGDTAGKNAALRHAHLLLPQSMESYILNLPEGEDPDTFLLIHGKEGFEQLLERKVPALDYLVQQTINKFPDSIQGRMQGLEELLPTLNQIKDPKRQQLTLTTIAERMKIPAEILSRELKRKTNKNLRTEQENVMLHRLPKKTTISQDEQWLLQSLLRNGQLWPRVREHLKPEEFKTPHFHRLYARLLQLPDEAFQAFDPLKLEESDPELFQSVMMLLEEEIPIHDFGLSLKRIKERNLEIEYQQSLLHSQNNEDRAKAGAKRRNEEEKLKSLKQFFQ